MNLWAESPDSLITAMRDAGLARAYLVTDPDSGELRASHPLLRPLAEVVAADARDYHGHQGAFFEIGADSDHLLGAFVHLTRRGQAAGGVRYWTYDTLEDYLRDGLRLARGMGHKCALAGLWWGGGKGVVARRQGRDHRDPALRALLYKDYGRFISGLRGCYITAEDVGTTPDDMANVFSCTRHTTCIPASYGGSGNPSLLTATGVVVAMEAALAALGRGSLEGKTVAMQGMGNVSLNMVGDLIERRVAKIVGADLSPDALEQVRLRYPSAPLDLRAVERGDDSILAEDCDLLAPNATGAILNPATIPTIKARVVCGAANNQLAETGRDARALQERGVLYVPDFLANRMGIVNCANEQYGVIPDDPAISVHLDREVPHGIFRRTLEVIERAQQRGSTPAAEAEVLADELSQELHPLWGNRGQVIIDALVRTGWAEERG